MVSITIRHLTKSFGQTLALDDVNLRIEAGEIFFLLGASGCGKTTLLRHIAGFYRPDEGAIFFDSTDVTSLAAHKRNTAMMFQSYALWPHLNVARNVAFGLEERHVPKPEIESRVAEALDAVHMGAFSSRKINQLSGGQQQRVALARALVVRPRCLLLDEPLSNLDAKLRLEMRNEIRSICKGFGLTAIYVTHDQKEALSIADRIAIMNAGRIEQIGTPVEIYREPATSYVAGFIGETNLIRATVEGESSRPSQFRLATDYGPFRGCAHGWTPAKGQDVILSIRPECLRLSTSSGSVNSFPGSLRESVYLGEIAQYQLETDQGTLLRISELNPSGIHRPDESPIHAHADPEDTLILRH